LATVTTVCRSKSRLLQAFMKPVKQPAA